MCLLYPADPVHHNKPWRCRLTDGTCWLLDALPLTEKVTRVARRRWFPEIHRGINLFPKMMALSFKFLHFGSLLALAQILVQLRLDGSASVLSQE